ncbi:hypothetical protein, partial [Rhizobium leguminosarum]|uniref:hypothetical protein n=1 Tax=Rhizobium leguminosarum TaxID=384 RepID=UPI003F97CB56
SRDWKAGSANRDPGRLDIHHPRQQAVLFEKDQITTDGFHRHREALGHCGNSNAFACAKHISYGLQADCCR